jgi:hypothetical protein
MISAQKVAKLLLFLCKHLPSKEVETLKPEIERILGLDVDKAAKLRKMRRDREGVIEALACAAIRE